MKQRMKKHRLLANQQKKHQKHYLQCSFCLNHYHAWWSKSSNQASRCASEIHLKNQRLLISCHYPSHHDTQRYFVIEKDMLSYQQIWLFHHPHYKQLIKHHYKTSMVICDHCIDKYIEQGKIIEDKKFDYWKPLNSLRVAELNNTQDWIELSSI